MNKPPRRCDNRLVAKTVVAQAVNDLPTCKRPAGANVATTGRICD